MKRVVGGIAVIAAVLTLGACFVDGAVEPLEGGETVNFGTVGPDGETQDMTFTIQNVGNATLQLFDTAGAYVEIEADNSGANNPYQATIEIRSDDPQNPSFELTLSAESSAQ